MSYASFYLLPGTGGRCFRGHEEEEVINRPVEGGDKEPIVFLAV